MSDATIPLAKEFNLKKLEYPVYISEKLDGVPVRIDFNYDTRSSIVTSRQGKPVPSVINDVHAFFKEVQAFCWKEDQTFVAEVTHKTVKGFKNVSGIVRRQEPQEGLVYNIFDYMSGGESEELFYIRQRQLKDLMYFNRTPSFNIIKQHRILDEWELNNFFDTHPTRPDQEGWVIRNHNAPFKPGQRHWDYQKVLVTPTEDLKLVNVEEAISKDGVPLGMAGKLWVEYNNGLIGCGPGALTHPERIKLWKDFNSIKPWHNPTIEVAYKKDQTYTALREARFVCFRPDKD